MTTKNLDLFTEFRNKNIQEEKIREMISLATDKGESVNKIEKYGRNLLLTACLYDNDNVFKYLAVNYADQFKEDFKQCILLTYTNKNPHILKESFHNLPEQTTEQKKDLSQKISKNCFREENINIAQEWLAKNLDEEQTQYFLSQLVKNNNKPFINYITKIPHWNKFLRNNEEEHHMVSSTLSEPLIENLVTKNDVLNTDIIKQETGENSVNKKSLIIVKKKNRISSLRNNL